MRPELIAATHPETRPENIIKGDCWRISVLTESLLRLEYSPEGIFEDRATQSVWNRDFPASTFRRIETEDSLEIITVPTTASGITEMISGIWAEPPALWTKQTEPSRWNTAS